MNLRETIDLAEQKAVFTAQPMRPTHSQAERVGRRGVRACKRGLSTTRALPFRSEARGASMPEQRSGFFRAASRALGVAAVLALAACGQAEPAGGAAGGGRGGPWRAVSGG